MGTSGVRSDGCAKPLVRQHFGWGGGSGEGCVSLFLKDLPQEHCTKCQEAEQDSRVWALPLPDLGFSLSCGSPYTPTALTTFCPNLLAPLQLFLRFKAEVRSLVNPIRWEAFSNQIRLQVAVGGSMCHLGTVCVTQS